MFKSEWKPGDWWAVCDICGLDAYASELELDYRGWRVHRDTCLDKRNSQEFVRPKPEKIIVPWIRPADTEGEISTTTISPGGTYDLDGDEEGPRVLVFTCASGTAAVSFPSPVNYRVPISFVLSISPTSTITTMRLSAAAGVQLIHNLGSSNYDMVQGVVYHCRSVPSQNAWYINL